MKTERMMDGDEQALRDVLSGVLTEYDLNICQHENVKRGGTIWTICEDCDRKWADDRGGFKPYVDPPAVAAAREALRTHRAKPVPTPRCEPPAGAKDGSLWWLTCKTINHKVVGLWLNNCWEFPGTEKPRKPIEIPDWTVHSECIFPVAKPETTAPVEPTDEAIAEFFAKIGRHPNWCTPDQIREIVDYFKPQVQKVEASDEAIMALRESLPTLSKAGPDGKSMHPDYCVIWPYSRAGIIQLVNAALTKFTPPKAGTLTDAEIAGEWKGNYGIPFSVVLEFARAIEAKIRSAA